MGILLMKSFLEIESKDHIKTFNGRDDGGVRSGLLEFVTDAPTADFRVARKISYHLKMIEPAVLYHFYSEEGKRFSSILNELMGLIVAKLAVNLLFLRLIRNYVRGSKTFFSIDQ